MVDFRQVVSRDTLSQIANGTDAQGDSLIRSLDSETTPPCRIRATDVASYDVLVDAVVVVNPATGRNRVAHPISGIQPTFTGATITFPAASGGNITNTSGSGPVVLSMNPNTCRKVGINISTPGQVMLTLGAAAPGISPLPACPSVPQGCLAAGYVLVICDALGVIQVITNSNIYQYAGSGGESNAGAVYGSFNVVATATYTVQANDYIILADTSLNAVTITLPPVSTNLGRMLVIKDAGGFASWVNKAVTISPAGADYIDMANGSVVMDNDFMSLTLMCGYAGWFII
jgi:hypothetical protein